MPKYLFILLFILLYTSKPAEASSIWIGAINPILSPQGGTWTHFNNPAITNHNSINALIEVNSSNNWRISLIENITSSNPIVHDHAVIQTQSEIDGDSSTSNPYILYNNDLGYYQAWYSSYGHSISGDQDYFRLKYATSSSLHTWTVHPDYVLKGTNNTWEGGGPARGLSVVYRNGFYQMWYTAFDRYFSNNWKIGYATSTNGIEWIKQNDNNPVLVSDTNTDLGNVSYPHVIINSNGTYTMWYGTSAGDLPTRFVYAVSSDGIHWTKPTYNNPQLDITPNNFDSMFISSPFVMQTPDGYEMYYSGYNGSYWSVGYATAAADAILIPTSHPTPTPTPEPSTPTATPTPIPTNTPLPTYTPTPVQPTVTPSASTTHVILIPGTTSTIKGSDLLTCSTSDENGWRLIPMATEVYSPLVKALTASGFTVHTYMYDWRKPISQNADRLKTYIQATIPAGSSVHLIGHSMGGLIARTYLETLKTDSRVDKLLTLGSPFEGSVNAYYTWSGAQILSNDLGYRMYLSGLTYICSVKKSVSQAEAVRKFVPSVSDLLPRFEYLKNETTGRMIPLDNMDAKNTWTSDDRYDTPYYGAVTGAIAGTGYSTPRTITVRDASAKEKAAGLWKDGKPVARNAISFEDGDGTVLVTSATSDGATVALVPVDHIALGANTRSIQRVTAYLLDNNLPTPKTIVSAHQTRDNAAPTPESGLFIGGQNIRIILYTPDRKILRDTDGIIEMTSPKTGIYTVILVPLSGNTTLFIGKFGSDGDIQWKHTQIKGRFPSVRKIYFQDGTHDLPKHLDRDIQ